MGKILIVGRCAVEMVLGTPYFPVAGETVYPDKYETRPGGRAGVAAYCAKLFSHKASILARVGKDGNASRLRNFFYDNGIATGNLFTDVSGQTPLDVYVRTNAYNPPAVLSYEGVSLNISEDDVTHAISENYDMALLQYESIGECAPEITKAIIKKNIRVFADLSRSDDASFLNGIKGIDVLMLSEEAVSSVSEYPLSDIENCLRAAIEISKKIGAYYYLINLDEKGIFIYDGTYYNLVSPCEPAERRKAGAPDLLAAVSASAYLESGDISASLRMACIADRMAKEESGVYIPGVEEIKRYAGQKI